MQAEATIENISAYRRKSNITLYILAKKNNTHIKLFYPEATATDMYKLINYNGPIEFELRMNQNLTSTHKGMSIPYFDVISYKCVKDSVIPTTFVGVPKPPLERTSGTHP